MDTVTSHVNDLDREGQAALHRLLDTYLIADKDGAVQACQAIKELVEQGASVSLRNEEGDMPLHLAIRCMAPASVVACLLDLGAGINKQNARGDTALHIHIGRYSNSDDWQAVFELLLERGADLKLKNSNGLDVLFLASTEKSWVVKVLLDHGADVHNNPKHSTCLHAAAEYGSLETLRLLVEAGADLNAKTMWGKAVDVAKDPIKRDYLIAQGDNTTFLGIAKTIAVETRPRPSKAQVADRFNEGLVWGAVLGAAALALGCGAGALALGWVL